MNAITPVEPLDAMEKKLKVSYVSLMRSDMFALWAPVLMVGTTAVVDDIPTAATNGRDKWFGRKLLAALDEKMVNFVVLHEASHVMLRHLSTWQALYKKNPRLANMACDYVINIWLVDTDPTERYLKMPMIDGKQVGLLDPRFRGMSTLQVFKILEQEDEEREKRRGRGEGGGDEPGEPGDGGGQPGEPGFDDHLWEEAQALSEEEKKELQREIDHAVRTGEAQARKKAGKGNGTMSRELEELLAPQVDWKEQMREFATEICRAREESSWSRPSRRFLSEDMYLPTLMGVSIGPVVTGVDTSGSCIAEAPIFISQIVALADDVNPERIDLLCWDSSVESHQEYTKDNYASMGIGTKYVGGGGTSPRCVLNWVNKRIKEGFETPVCIIMLTDGLIDDWGENWPAPVLWVITENSNYARERKLAPNGTTIHINS